MFNILFFIKVLRGVYIKPKKILYKHNIFIKGSKGSRGVTLLMDMLYTGNTYTDPDSRLL